MRGRFVSRKAHRALGSLIAVAVLSSLGSAQAQTRGGFFLGLGAGWGSAKTDCDSCQGGRDRQDSVATHLRVGTTLSERLALGVELNGWFHTNISLIGATAAFYLYPNDQGLFFKAGVGLSRDDVPLGSETLAGVGWGAMAGIGYDIPIGSSFAVTPVATFRYAQPGDLRLDGETILSGFKHNVIEVGVGLTFY